MSNINSLRERMMSYEKDIVNFKHLNKLPVIIVLNGRSFKKTTSLLQKPFDQSFLQLMCATTMKLAYEIDGTALAYAFSDEIVIVSRNDQTHTTLPWCDNRIQKIVSIASSIATSEFNRTARTNNVKLFGDAIFTAKTFVVPNITEAINYIISKQNTAFNTSLSMAVFYALLKEHDIETVKQIISLKTAQEKAEILFEQFGIDFNGYDPAFRRGVCVYRAPKIINIDGVERMKNKFTLDMDVPLFTRDTDFLSGIFRAGSDILRIES